MEHKKKSGGAKGVYLALAIGAVIAGGLVTAAITGGMNDPVLVEEEPLPTVTRQVDVPVTNVPDERTVTTTTTTKATAAATEPVEEVNAPVQPQLMVLPMGNQLLAGFSNGKPVYSDTMADFRSHDGADFAGKAGDKVAAVSAGTVTAIEEDALWGKTVVIDHGHGIVSTYRGVTATVQKGDKVKAGNPIGTLSDIPCELLSGAHLHLEITVGGEAVDPVSAIGVPVAEVTTKKAGTSTTASSGMTTAR
ncbi:MAG: peptidoglycan DD-metalloendopeptidase family protein [Acutalibacteraceae bacterium]|jgi:murein DD-endopeptidase MepM/ murein hydrolase activator NlpD